MKVFVAESSGQICGVFIDPRKAIDHVFKLLEDRFRPEVRRSDLFIIAARRAIAIWLEGSMETAIELAFIRVVPTQIMR